MTITDRVSPSVISYSTNNNKSTHSENLGKIPAVFKKLHQFENSDKISRHLEKCTEPDGKTPGGASVA
jgi:hypothetical protein